MKTVIVYSEAGGVSKTTTAVSLAAVAAQRGTSTLLIDLDPRAAATKWLGVTPAESWHTTASIIASPEPDGWARDFAISTSWSDNLHIVPSERALSNREREQADHAELRLMASLEGIDQGLVIVDCPNRQGGMLTQNALAAADGVIYAATASQDGVDGVIGAKESVRRFVQSRQRIGAPVKLQELGTVVGNVAETVMTRVARAAIDDLEEIGNLLHPVVPRRTVVEQVRMTCQWYGDFTKGKPVAESYEQIFDQLTLN